jgi:hypothetical protein
MIHRSKITKQDQITAAKHAIRSTSSPLRITPGMWQALRERLGKRRRR